jgi:hypothetical protein
MFDKKHPVREASRVHFDHSLNTRLKSWNQLVACGQDNKGGENSFCFTDHPHASSPFTRLLPFTKQSALSTIRCRDFRVDNDQLSSWDASLHP